MSRSATSNGNAPADRILCVRVRRGLWERELRAERDVARRVDEYELDALEVREWAGEPVYAIRGRSLRDFSYAHLVFFVARSDGAILATHYFKRGQDAPYRVIRAPRAAMIERDGHVLPTRLIVENHARGTTTEVLFSSLEVNPAIDDHVFSVTSLEQQRRLPVEQASHRTSGSGE